MCVCHSTVANLEVAVFGIERFVVKAGFSPEVQRIWLIPVLVINHPKRQRITGNIETELWLAIVEFLMIKTCMIDIIFWTNIDHIKIKCDYIS